MMNKNKDGKVNLLTPYLINSIIGDDRVTEVSLKNFESNEIETHDADELIFIWPKQEIRLFQNGFRIKW